jgi:tetratricopeptide (TPR) repeat protein
MGQARNADLSAKREIVAHRHRRVYKNSVYRVPAFQRLTKPNTFFMSTKRFRIAFSFAGEKRDFVAKVAAILADRFGESAILYDKFHEATFARSDLGIHLPDLYHNESDLVVLAICKDYESKEWCGLEWTAIHALIKERKVEDVMLCRFDHALIKGLYSTAGFVELDHKLPGETAKLILKRLKANGIDTRKRKRTPKAAAGAPDVTSTPNNLPRLQSFFGRAEELKKIADALAPKTRTWGVLIDGPGGMGKTSLAIRAAELVPVEQFLNIFFLSSKERKLTAEGERKLSDFVTPGYLDMLNEMARLLKQPELAKQPEAKRARMLIDALTPAKALLILDNLESMPKDQQNRLFEFLSQLPPGCKAIVTSRVRTDVDARIIRLAKLDQDAALELIAELATDRPLLAKAFAEERIHLYEETGGNPLLLRWIAGQLGRGQCRTISSALDLLRTAAAENDPLEFVFGDLLGTFTENETKVLSALTYFTQQVEVKLIAELANISRTAAETALGDLANRALVVPDEEEKRFALVPMVADFLRRKRPEVVTETGNRLEQRAYALIVENGYDKHDHFPVLDEAWLTVAPALPLFVAGPNKRLQTVCAALDFFFDFTGRWDEWFSLSEQAEAKALTVGDHSSAGWRAFQAGWVNYHRKQADALLASADRAAAHWKTAQAGAHERSLSIRRRGMGYELKENYPAAISAFREALDLERTLIAESDEVAILLNDLAMAEHAAGDFAAAERDYRDALRIARAVAHTEMIAGIPGNLASLALDRKDWPEAETLARKALSLAEGVGRLELIASDCLRVATALVRQGKGHKALPYAQHAADIFTRLGLPDLEDACEILSECENQPNS